MAETGPEKSVLKSSPATQQSARVPLPTAHTTRCAARYGRRRSSRPKVRVYNISALMAGTLSLRPQQGFLFASAGRVDRGKGGDEWRVPPPPNRPGLYEQVLVEASHFMWAFSQEAFVLCCSAASVGVTQPATSPSATSAVTSFFMEASPGNERYLASVARIGYGRTD